MTRIQIKQRRRAVQVAVIAGSIIGLFLGVSVAGWDAEAFKTACAVVGAWVIAYGILRVVLWLDGQK